MPPAAPRPSPGNFNPRSPCGERLQQSIKIARSGISIHAPRVGSDPYWCTSWSTSPDFNPRSPCGERPSGFERRLCFMNFNPRSPCGERQCPGWNVPLPCGISIHAPRVGSDGPARASRSRGRHFNPRSPCGERRFAGRLPFYFNYFNPRSPCGERPPGICRGGASRMYFNPRSPCGERRYGVPGCRQCYGISIHAPRVGSDSRRTASTSSGLISIHAPRVGSDGDGNQGLCKHIISIHAPRVGSDN